LSFTSNIYVVKDPSHPENEGKVMLFKYGKKIFDKLNAAMNPEFEDESPLNPFDLWAGANFKLKIRKVDGYQNYDKSEFETPGPLSEDDAEMEKIWKREYPLVAFLDRKNFKSYGDIKALQLLHSMTVMISGVPMMLLLLVLLLLKLHLRQLQKLNLRHLNHGMTRKMMT
jgi:hypothetical protein